MSYRGALSAGEVAYLLGVMVGTWRQHRAHLRYLRAYAGYVESLDRLAGR